jgi:alkanesulfonate monooxygenase SsuD/methylene tetrahydromethanopterin reductase-like flavin-dependent oxidoreductase (luciferase family)
VKVGITLPHFRDEADTAMAAARRAEELGIDGVFCFDHLWPMGQPDRPAISSGPLLGALAAATTTIRVGTLVARIGLLPDEVLVAELSSVDGISGGRVIAGLGTGDRLSRAENDAYGIPFEPAEVRRVRLGAVAVALAARGIPVWVGGGRPSTTELARTVGGAVNLWEGEVHQVAELSAAGYEVTWGGSVQGDHQAAERRLGEIAGAGATWAVCAWTGSLDAIAAAARSVS